jgi:predicted DNA-binding transcriptional regulator AlpA
MPEKTRLHELLENVLPPILFRNHPRFKELTGLSSSTVRNEDSRGTGPSERIIIGRVVGYPREAFLTWLDTKAKEKANG